jgi:hypothetical protein
MTFTGQITDKATDRTSLYGSGRFSFGAPLNGVREHPVEMSSTVVLPHIPITILNESILVTGFDPSPEGQPGLTS